MRVRRGLFSVFSLLINFSKNFPPARPLQTSLKPPLNSLNPSIPSPNHQDTHSNRRLSLCLALRRVGTSMGTPLVVVGEELRCLPPPPRTQPSVSPFPIPSVAPFPAQCQAPYSCPLSHERKKEIEKKEIIRTTLLSRFRLSGFTFVFLTLQLN